MLTRRGFVLGVAGLLAAPAAAALASQAPPERGARVVRLWNRLCASVTRQNEALGRLDDSYHRKHPQGTVAAGPDAGRCADLVASKAEAAEQLECLTGLHEEECVR